MPGSGAHPGTDTAQGAESRGIWRSSLPAVFVLTVALTAIFWPTVATLLVAWSDTGSLTYTHGYLIAAMCAWLLARAGRALAVRAPDWRMAVLLIILSGCWLLFYRAGIEVLHQVLLPTIAIVAAAAAFGMTNGRKLSFAFAYLYFAVPIWSVGNEILQSITVFAVRILLQITAIPAFVTGNIVHIPAGVFEIAGGCSGLHFFIVALAIAAIFGEIHHDSLRIRVQQVVLAALLAMVSNWVRVYVLIVVGHLTDMQHYLITVDHYYFGWFLFVFTMVAFFWIAGRMPANAHDALAAVPEGPRRHNSWAGGVLIAVVAAGIGPAVNSIRPVQDAVASQAALPAANRWSGPFPVEDSWRPAYPQANRTELAEYRIDGRTATAFVAQYFQQHQGRELIGFDNVLAGSESFVDNSRVVQTARGDAAIMETSAQGGRWVIAYNYLIGDARVTGDFRAQVAYATASLQGPVLSQVVAVRVPCAGDCEAARMGATDLLDELNATIAESHGK